MRRILFLILSIAMMLPISTPAFAQKSSKVSVSLFEDGGTDVLGYATVSLTAKNATRVYKYTLTNDQGTATFSEVKNGTYVLKAELMGYVTLEKEFSVKDADVNLGKLAMKLDTQALDAASVSAVGNPIVIKKDTIEYNASSFKTNETDVLEDLLKKLPGVEVGTDGSITANGQTVSKVYIDGKTFFMDDPAVASKNLPAKMVNKVKVVKKKSDQAEFTGIEDGEEETVLDLSVQQSMMDGLMGNVNLGAGHDVPAMANASEEMKSKIYNDARYSSNLFMGKFSNGKQFSLIGNANNGGNVGFGDRGGMNRGSGGVTTSYMLGANLGADLLDDKMELTGNYSLNGMDNDSWNKSYRENYFEGYTRFNNNETQSLSNNLGHRIGMRIKHDFSKSSSLIFEPSINFTRGENTSLETFDTDVLTLADQVFGKEKDGFSFNGGSSQNVSASGRLQYRQRLGIPGRTLVINSNFSFSDNRQDGYTQSLTNNYQNSNLFNTDIINQRNKQGSTSQSASVRMNYTEPLGNYFYVEASYNLNWSHSQSYKDAFDAGPFDVNGFTHGAFVGYSPRHDVNPVYNPLDEIRNIANSNEIINDNLRQTAGLEMLYQSTKLRAQVGFNIIPTRIHNYTDRETYQIDTTYSILNWSPTAMVIWDPTNSTNIRFNYRGSSSQPSVSQLVPVLDNSNPIMQSLGNPYLNPSFSHNISLEDRYTNRQRFSSYSIRINGGFNQDPVVTASWSKVGGKTYSMPVNGPTAGNIGVNFFANFPIKRSNFSINTSTGATARVSSSYTGTNIDTEKYLIRNADGEVADFDYPAFRSDYADIDNSKDFSRNDTRSLNINERFTLQYRSDALEIRLGAGTTYQRTSYSLRPEQNLNQWSNNANFSVIWDWDSIGLSVNPDFNYRWYYGFTTDRPSEALLNCTVEKNIFKNRATIALVARDILGQTKNFSVATSANSYSETYTNSLGRYIMATFQWRFGTFGGRGGRGGHGGGMRGMGGRGRGGFGGF